MLTSAFADSLRRRFGYQFPRLGARGMNWCLSRIPPAINCELFPGIRLNMNLGDLTQRSTFWQGSRFEAPTARILARSGAGAKVFFDIGSNYGFFSYWMLHRLPEIEVYAFEPNPETFETIRRAQLENALTRIHPQNVGLSDSVGSLDLHPGTQDSGHSTFARHPGLSAPPVKNIPVETFDGWAEGTGLAEPGADEWIAKIDVEGFELRVLAGMRNALSRGAFRLLVVEINEFTLSLAGTAPEQLREFLNDMGYFQPEVLHGASQGDLAKSGNGFFVPAGSPTKRAPLTPRGEPVPDKGTF
jgi:FkbM family methyltransferase